MKSDPRNRQTTRLVDLSLVGLPAVQRAGYALAEKYDVILDRKAGDWVELSVTQQKGGPAPPEAPEIDRLLLDFTLRVDIEERTREVRSAIVTAALRNGR
jgi:His-Xaa-Ser system protein HxsD